MQIIALMDLNSYPVAMKSTNEIIKEFLESKRIAIAGVSTQNNQPANSILKKMQKAGYEVYPVNPNLDTFNGEECYAKVNDIPVPISSVLICTHPEVSSSIIDDCVKGGVKRVWFHRSIGMGSFSSEAQKKAEENDLEVIPMGCPMMYLKPVDPFHWCFKKILQLQGKLGKTSSTRIGT